MLLSRSFKYLAILLLTGAVAQAFSPCLLAGPICERVKNKVKYCHCKPSKEVFYLEFFGYYRTCWRPWPGGQPPCPPPCGALEVIAPAEQLPAAEEKGPAQKSKKEAGEQLPAPKPEKMPK